MNSTERNIICHPDLREFRVPARADRIAEVREVVRDWLYRCGIDSAQTYDVLLAVSEAVTNAVEHGHRHAPGSVRIEGALTDSDIRVTVADHGHWKPKDSPGGQIRGRGLDLIRALMTSVTVHTDATGTRIEMRLNPILRQQSSPHR
ncbi:ATP-binding protein [Nocardia goodfellowii]|uniref:Anti-sigma regulatory factor (Ser/Thr protein kinase) n=1 Tax=Nocardia goodfellowii TaxID=882446 RepID=A0ABS4QIQ9_9NOCA|nr:ATP-binding protein [Nocardia goodfellowii]MBP2191592.1 anti-sigma regulatory factor (Ser/Thr protein kinase) [Nocardia goodfellowii]